MRLRLLLALLLPGLLAAPGCSLGPKKLPATRMDYNVAVQRSNNEEMLLNLVRMKYFEQPLFLQVGSIASSFSYNVSAGATASVPDERDFVRSIYTSYTPTFTAQYTDAPTVTYTPFQGQAYTQQFLSEMDFDRLVVLYKSGWDIEYLLQLLVVRIGRLDHSYDARIGFMPGQHEKFMELVKIISDIDDRGGLDIVTVSPGKDKANIIVMTLRYADDAEAARVGQLTGLDLRPERTALGHIVSKVRLVPVREYDLLEERNGADRLPVLPLRLRNCLRAMDMVAQGVEVPPGLLAKKRGFDLRQACQGLCDIRTSTAQPSDAYAAVKHQGHWYFIGNDDARSKEIFQLVLNIFALQSADPPKNTPVLTLPVGAN